MPRITPTRTTFLVGAALTALAFAGCGDDDASGTSAGTGGETGSAGSSSTNGSQGTGASSGTGGGSSGTGASGTGGSGGSGGSVDLGCAPLAAPTGPTIPVTPAQAAELPQIVFDAPSGTTIVLDPGTYLVPATLQLRASGVTLRSSNDDAAAVILDGDYAVNEIIQITASDVTVAHVTVTRAIDHPIHAFPPGPGVNITGTVLYGLRLIDGGEQFVKVNPIVGQDGYVDEGLIACSLFRMTDAGRSHVSACYTGGIDVHAGWGWVVTANRFEDIYCESGGLAEHAVHFWKGARDTLVENNLILNCARGIGFGLESGTGQRVYPDSPHGGADLAHYDGIIRNNVIWSDIPWHDTGIELHETRQPLVLHNTVMWGPGATNAYSSIDWRFDQTLVTVKNNLADRFTERDLATADLGVNVPNAQNQVGIGADLAWFVDASGLDFHLAAGAAPAVDQGTVEAEAGLDIDGETHDLGAGPDLGADER